LFIAIGLLLLLSLLGLNRLSLDVNFSDYFSPKDPRFIAFNNMNANFERHDQLWLLLESEQDWRDKTREQALMQFVAEISALPAVSGVQGYNQFVQNPRSSKGILAYKKHPRLDSVLSADGHAILLQLQLDEAHAQHFNTRSLWLIDTLDNIELQSQQFWQPLKVDSYLNGTHALNWQYAKVLRHDLSWFAPSLLLIILMMAILFIRQVTWVVALCVNSLVTLVLTLGLAAWLQLTLSAISAFVPVIIVTLTLAYASHLYFGWQGAINDGLAPAQALALTVNVNQAPLFYSSLTTILGFCLLTLSPSPPIQSFGLLVAFAVLCNYLLSLTTLIFFAQYSQAKVRRNWQFIGVIALAKHNAKRPNTVMVGIVLLSVLASFSVAKLSFNDDPLGYFKPDNTFSVSSQKMQQHFAGINLQHYVVKGLSNEQFDKTELSFIYQFARFLKQQTEVNKVQHIGDWIRSTGLGRHQFQRLLAENTVNELHLQSELSATKNAALVTLYLKPMTATELIAFENKVHQWLVLHGSTVEVSPPLGSNILFAHLCIDNANNMLLSFGVALLALAVLLGVLKGSLCFAAMGLLLNFLPLLWVFALWQLNGGFISLGTAIVLGMMLGVIVDDTLHLMLKLPKRTQANMDVTSMWQRLSQVLPVVSFTTLTICMGFAVGLLSDFSPISQLSLLSCLIVLFAWGFDVLMLPVLYQRWVLRKPHD